MNLIWSGLDSASSACHFHRTTVHFAGAYHRLRKRGGFSSSIFSLPIAFTQALSGQPGKVGVPSMDGRLCPTDSIWRGWGLPISGMGVPSLDRIVQLGLRFPGHRCIRPLSGGPFRNAGYAGSVQTRPQGLDTTGSCWSYRAGPAPPPQSREVPPAPAHQSVIWRRRGPPARVSPALSRLSLFIELDPQRDSRDMGRSNSHSRRKH